MPISSSMKVIYRDLLAACPQMKWDDVIPPSFNDRIEHLLIKVLQLQGLHIDRYLLKGFPEESKRRLLVFCDGGMFGNVVRVFIGSKVENKESGLLSAALVCGKHKLPDPPSMGLSLIHI